MKKNLTLMMVALLATLTASAQPLLTLPDASPAVSLTQRIGITDVTINYNSPRVNKRTIWGALVPYGQVWRMGANANTTITLSHDVKIEGQPLKAGTYGMHLIPDEGAGTLIFSTNSSSWGSYHYDQKEDALRVEVKAVPAEHQEWLAFEISDRGKDFSLVAMRWEKLMFPFEIKVDVNQIVVDNIKNEIRGVNGFFWPALDQAANYCLSNDIELEQGLEWAKQAVEIEKNFNTVSTQAGLMAKLGKTDEADKMMADALDMPTATIGDVYGYGRQLIARGDKKGAMVVFERNYKKDKSHWLAIHGMARGYSANGNIAKALEMEKKALAICPDGSKGFLEGYVKTLEKGEDFN